MLRAPPSALASLSCGSILPPSSTCARVPQQHPIHWKAGKRMCRLRHVVSRKYARGFSAPVKFSDCQPRTVPSLAVASSVRATLHAVPASKAVGSSLAPLRPTCRTGVCLYPPPAAQADSAAPKTGAETSPPLPAQPRRFMNLNPAVAPAAMACHGRVY